MLDRYLRCSLQCEHCKNTNIVGVYEVDKDEQYYFTCKRCGKWTMAEVRHKERLSYFFSLPFFVEYTKLNWKPVEIHNCRKKYKFIPTGIATKTLEKIRGIYK